VASATPRRPMVRPFTESPFLLPRSRARTAPSRASSRQCLRDASGSPSATSAPGPRPITAPAPIAKRRPAAGPCTARTLGPATGSAAAPVRIAPASARVPSCSGVEPRASHRVHPRTSARSPTRRRRRDPGGIARPATVIGHPGSTTMPSCIGVTTRARRGRVGTVTSSSVVPIEQPPVSSMVRSFCPGGCRTRRAATSPRPYTPHASLRTVWRLSRWSGARPPRGLAMRAATPAPGPACRLLRAQEW
jgi:hypothetical protein